MECNGVFFDIVAGPDSGPMFDSTESTMDGRVRLHQERRDLPLLHAAADIVICNGSYNSIVEAMEGSAHLICASGQPPDAEQVIHATRLSRFIPLEWVVDISELKPALDRALAKRAARRSRGREILNFQGAAGAREIILSALR
jgi:predicted glycosyltransferase